MITRANLISTAHTETVNLPINYDRTYLAIFAPDGATIEFGDGGGAIPILNGYYEPIVVTTGEVEIVPTTGTFYVVESVGNTRKQPFN